MMSIKQNIRGSEKPGKTSTGSKNIEPVITGCKDIIASGVFSHYSVLIITSKTIDLDLGQLSCFIIGCYFITLMTTWSKSPKVEKQTNKQ